MPEVNAAVGGLTVDFLWRDIWLIVETDGWKFHRGREAFENDRSRDAHLRRLGFEVLRFSYRQVFDEPATVIAAIRAAIDSRSALFRRHATEKRRDEGGAG